VEEDEHQLSRRHVDQRMAVTNLAATFMVDIVSKPMSMADPFSNILQFHAQVIFILR
jgi:hypothetical protein